jgi:hypothetical protein
MSEPFRLGNDASIMALLGNAFACSRRAAGRASVAAAFCAAFAPGDVWAQAESVASPEPERGVPVLERARPDYDPVGIRRGSFVFYPRGTLQVQYDDNIYATDKNPKDDLITILSPALAVRSDWTNHALNVDVNYSAGMYASQQQELFMDYSASIDGRLDITRNSSFSGALSVSHEHEERGSPDEVFGREPTEFTVYTAQGGYFHRFNRVTTLLEGTYNRLDYRDVAQGPGTQGVRGSFVIPSASGQINNDDRDRDEYDLTARAGYEIQPGYEAFLRGTYNWRDYLQRRDDAGFKRDSEGYRVEAGARLDLTGIIFADIFAGYLRQNYEDSDLKTVDGWLAGLTGYWNVTGLTTITGSINRRVSETTQPDASGSLDTDFSINVDHELRRNVILSGGLRYANSDYKGFNREDDLYSGNIGATYLINRNAQIRAAYTHTTRESNRANLDYSRNIVLLTLRVVL